MRNSLINRNRPSNATAATADTALSRGNQRKIHSRSRSARCLWSNTIQSTKNIIISKSAKKSRCLIEQNAKFGLSTQYISMSHTRLFSHAFVRVLACIPRAHWISFHSTRTNRCEHSRQRRGALLLLSLFLALIAWIQLGCVALLWCTTRPTAIWW